MSSSLLLILYTFILNTIIHTRVKIRKNTVTHTSIEPHPTTIRNRVPVLHSEKHRQQQQSGEQNR